jgi:hypothetical protein
MQRQSCCRRSCGFCGVPRRARYGSPRDDEATRVREADLDHVALNGLGEADTGVEALRDDVHEPILGVNLDLHLRIPLDEPRQESSHDEGHRRGRHRQPDAARDLTGPGRYGLQGLQRLVHCRACGLEQALSRVRERDGPGRPREQRDAEARLELPNGLAQRGGGDPEVPCSSREAAVACDRDERVEGVERSEGHREGFLHELAALRQRSAPSGGARARRASGDLRPCVSAARTGRRT